MEFQKIPNHKIFLDSGSRVFIENYDILKNTWSAIAGSFDKSTATRIKLKVLEINQTIEIVAKCDLVEHFFNYRIDLGRDILDELALTFDF